MSERNRKGPGSPGPSKYERTFQRAKAWAERQPPEELAVHFAGLLTTCLIEREIHRHRQGAAEEAALSATAREVMQAVTDTLERKEGARSRWARDPRSSAMKAIRHEWERWRRNEVVYRSDADFGRKMHLKHPEFTSDRSIAQRAAAWRKEARNTRS